LTHWPWLRIGRQGMPTPHRHLIPPLVYPDLSLICFSYRIYKIDDCKLHLKFKYCLFPLSDSTIWLMGRYVGKIFYFFHFHQQFKRCNKINNICLGMLVFTLLDTFTEFMYNMNEKNILKKIFVIKWGNKIFWVAVIFMGRSERGNKPNFHLGPICISFYSFLMIL
jgi:hypothetical protein